MKTTADEAIRVMTNACFPELMDDPYGRHTCRRCAATVEYDLVPSSMHNGLVFQTFALHGAYHVAVES